jgi:hypothetical protein
MIITTIDPVPCTNSPLKDAATTATLDDVALQMDLLTTEGDEAIAHVEADRLLMQALLIAAISAKLDGQSDVALSIIASFNKIRKYYE